MSVDASWRKDSRIDEARAIIEREFGSPLTSIRLARRLRLPHLAFHHAFVLTFAQTPEQYLRAWRLKQAAELLAAGCSDSDAALQVGYTSFRRFVVDYRRIHRNDLQRLQVLDRQLALKDGSR